MTLPKLRPHEPWWARDAATVVDELATDPSLGLSSSEATERLTVLGPNELDEEPTRPLWLLFAGQFANTMIVVLLIAAAITVAIGDLKDAAVIVAIVILNAAIGFFQEYRAEQAMASLRNMAAPSARVVRDGVQATVPARELVPGDLVLLTPATWSPPTPASSNARTSGSMRLPSPGSRFPSTRPPTRCQKTKAHCWQIGATWSSKGRPSCTDGHERSLSRPEWRLPSER